MPKTMNWLFLIFIGMGSLFLAVGGGIAWYNYRFIASALTAEGTVIELEEYSDSDGSYYRPIVRFKAVSGEEITMRDSGGSNPPLYDEGESVTVYYSPDDPRDAKLNSWIMLWALPGFFGGLGFMFAVIPALIWNGMRRAAARREELKLTGQRIEADITGVGYNTSLRVNGRHPWVIRAQWYDINQGGVRTFESESLWFDPAPYLGDRKTIGVFIDPAKPSRYAVDTSFLPKHLE